MAHQKIIDSVKKQGQVTIKDLDEFLRFVINEYDMRTLNNNYISILIPMQLDVNNVFGLDVCKRSDDDYVILYSCWYPNCATLPCSSTYCSTPSPFLSSLEESAVQAS